ncbi:MAG: metal ABC transporter permease [Thiohalomonadaceae bacterium]
MIDDLAIIAPAFAAGLLVLASHVPLGRRVLERGIIFIDIALAQFASLGMVLAHILHLESAWITQAGAFAAALIGAALLNLSERLWPEVQEAIIGSSFVVTASLAILLLANDPHGGEQLHELLVGQILWSRWQDLLPLAGITLLVLGAWFGLDLQRSRAGFYLLFALAVTMSVQIVGVYLVFASLILPALAVRHCGARRGLALGYAIGALGYGSGLLLSLWFDLPSGAIIVCMLAAGTAVVLPLLQRRQSTA